MNHNFLFKPTNDPNDMSCYFLMLSFTVAEAQFHYEVYASEGPPVLAHWSLTASPDSGAVPDGGLTIAMLGTAMTGLAFIRRKL